MKGISPQSSNEGSKEKRGENKKNNYNPNV